MPEEPIFINNLPKYYEKRLVQLIQMYDRGEELEIANKKQVELLLILFSWILTSSNRWLRDYTSKAMIEILKKHFQLCQFILDRFKNVNDPYLVQRLYGIVFGACCKRTEGDFQGLAEYVYEIVFNQEKVYPDILLRDYARLIIELFLKENPEYSGIIVREKIIPPYNSDPIPNIEDQHYKENKHNGAIPRLVRSMRIENMGGYGDFGRYVFQRTLAKFDVDIKKMFNYALYHIIKDLGFNEEYFGEHDCQCRAYDGCENWKIERIGKKYQWITLYNVLARVADHCKMLDRWSDSEKDKVCFKGAWDLYIRDFDPTLNHSFMACDEAPNFKIFDEHVVNGIAENRLIDISDTTKLDYWLENKGSFLSELKDSLILTDDNKQQWICLTKYCDTGRIDFNAKKLFVWSWLYAYFMTPEQEKEFVKVAEKRLPIINSDIASHHKTFTIFNREYPWSPSCSAFEEYAWVDCSIRTGEMVQIAKTVQETELSPMIALIHEYDKLLDEKVTKDEISEVHEIQIKKMTQEREKEKGIGKILHATTELLWEEECDATKESAINYSMPCAKIIEVMGLRQLVSDGYFYDYAGKLAAFDTNLTQKVNSVVIRKDILDEFLMRTGMRLVWLVDAEKEIHKHDYSIERWSDWQAVYRYEGKSITGEIIRMSQDSTES